MKNKRKIPTYLKNLIKKYPDIASGRKNFEQHQYRIMKTLDLIKKYFNLKN